MFFNPARLGRVLAALSLLLLGLSTYGVARAHEHRELGPFEVVVGWSNEPALVEQPNGLDLRISRLADETAVEGVEETLTAEILYGDQVMPLELRARFGQPGSYTSDVIPTVTGSYIFHLQGTIEGTAVDERFNSADGEFSDIEAVSALQFPEPVGVGSELQGSLRAAEAAAANARLLALGGLVAGLLGLALGGLALTRRTR